MDALQLLLKACGAAPYRSNAFRMLALPVDASAGDISKRRKIIDIERKGGDFSGGAGHLALRPPPSADDIRLAAETLREPAERLVQELFWFWPSEPGQAARDPALKALQEGEVDDALFLWLDAERKSGPADIARHNLAVLAHFSACESESQVQMDAGTAPAARAASNDYWARAFKRWLILTQESRFWDRLAERIRNLKDPQLTPEMAEKMRGALGPALLSINADFAIKAAEAGNAAEAGRHVALIKQSGFAAHTIEQSLQRAAQPIVARITANCQKAKNAIQDGQVSPVLALEAARNLLSDTQPHLAIIALFFSPDQPAYQSPHDEVANVAGQCELRYSNQTKDWKTSLEMLQKIHAIASSASTKTRMEGEIAKVQVNLLDLLCHTALVDSKADPARADQAAQTLLAEAQCVLGQIPSSHPQYESLHDMVAGSVLSCQVMHGNQTSDWATSLELLQKVLTVAVGASTKSKIKENIEIVQENLVMQRCQEAEARAAKEPRRANEAADWLLDLLVPRVALGAGGVGDPGLAGTGNTSGDGRDRENLGHVAKRFGQALKPVVDAAHPRYQEICDCVALRALDCAIIFGNHTNDWSSTVRVMERIEQIAMSSAVKARIAGNIWTARRNRGRSPSADYLEQSRAYLAQAATAQPQPAPASGAQRPRPNNTVFDICVAIVVFLVVWQALGSNFVFELLDHVQPFLADIAIQYSFLLGLVAAVAYLWLVWRKRR